MTELHHALQRCRRGLGAVFGFSMIVNLLMLTVAIYMLQVYDRVLASQSTATLLYLTFLAFAFLMLLGIFELLRLRILARIGSWLDQILSPTAFRRALDASLYAQPYRTEALRDVSAIRGFLSGSSILAMFDSPWVPIYVTVIFLLHPILGVFAFFGAIVLFLLALINNVLTRLPLGRANAAQTRGLMEAELAFRNAEVVDGMGMRETFIRRWNANNATALSLQTMAADHAATFTSVTKSFRLVLQVGVLGLGAWLVLKGELSPGGMIAASIILGRALAPVEQAIGAWRQTLGARDAWRRLTEMFARPPLHPAAMALPRPKGHLSVEAITYSPHGARLPVLKNITLDLEPGDVLAVIGPSAAGKSTLARLLVGIGQPQFGRVRLDSADVFSLSRETFGRYVGYLPQDVELFPGTIRENIARMENGDPRLIVEAADMAGVHEMILRLPNGYDTEIQEQGGVLSGGQRQRIGLARALYGRPSLLVLDEPNASLDSAGEDALNEAIASVKHTGATTVLIAHRPSMMKYVDKVAVLKEGQLQMFGARDTVLARLQRRGLVTGISLPAATRIAAQGA